MKAQPRERFSSEIKLTPAMVAAYAHAAGDTNPIHHDPEFAASSRYGRLIASGTHTTALLLGLTASHFSKKGSVVGLEFWVRFRRPVSRFQIAVARRWPQTTLISLGESTLRYRRERLGTK
jgi:acyl dehydratase